MQVLTELCSMDYQTVARRQIDRELKEKTTLNLIAGARGPTENASKNAGSRERSSHIDLASITEIANVRPN